MLTKLPKIYGLCKIRNEGHIINDTLSNWSDFCTAGIYVYDDCSTDGTVEICKNHDSVAAIIRGTYWDPAREKAEWFNRQQVLMLAQQEAGPDDWFVYFDADEHIYNFTDYEMFENPTIKAIACRLYDFYITDSDKDKHYKEREWIGPEYRTIPFFFRNSPYLKYYLPDQRIVTMEEGIQIPIHGDIRHYGKSFSVAQYEETCDYYINWWPKYADKWKKRKGKAIKEDMLSDFGNKLIKWEDRKQGFSLETQSYGRQ